MKRFFVMLSSILALFSCKGQQLLDVDSFSRMLEENDEVQLVDVRTPEEFADGHLALAANIDWKGSGFIQKAEIALDKKKPVLIYCRSGRRSAEAAQALKKAGFNVYDMKGGILKWKEAGKPTTKYEVERFFTKSKQRVDITLIKHGSLEIRYNGLSIQVDPVAGYGKPTDYATEFPKADIILVTHEHADHLDPETLAALTKESTRLILNRTSSERIGRGEIIANGETLTIHCITLDAVPAYNTTPGREKFHPKGNGNGYVLTLNGLRIYIAGDTEDIPEMANLKDIDLAFLPVNQPYTMTPEQCIAAAKAFSPKVLIPYHYSNTDISGIPDALSEIDVRIRQMQ